RRQAHVQEMNGLLRWTYAWQTYWEKEPAGQAQRAAARGRFLRGRPFRTVAEGALETLSLPHMEGGVLSPGRSAVWPMVLWPLAWVLWACLLRGGISYRFAGIALVRNNGRPAWRLQCLLRALLVWAPVAGLFALSVWLDLRFWSFWP